MDKLHARQLELEEKMLILGREDRAKLLASGRVNPGLNAVKGIISDMEKKLEAVTKNRKSTIGRDLLKRAPNLTVVAANGTAELMTLVSRAHKQGRVLGESQAIAAVGASAMADIHREEARSYWQETTEPRVVEVDRAPLHLGTVIAGAFFQSNGDRFLARKQRGYNKPMGLSPTQTLLDFEADAPEFFTPHFLPCVEPPVPWAIVNGRLRGGYHTEEIQKRTELVQGHAAGSWKTLSREFASKADQTRVLDAVNAVQAVAWRINEPIFERLLIENKTTTEETSATLALRAAGLVHDVPFYFPHVLQITGRMQPLPADLTTYGDDAIKGLLRFAEGKPITDQEQADALAIHGANVFGQDKLTRQGRLDWVKANEHMILAVADGESEEWRKADGGDGRWQFLAFCHEWAGYIRQGFGYVSSLPVKVDGSSNGLQHFSAMLRDPIGGAATNLIPAEKPRDLYTDVAEAVNKTLGRKDITRKIAKACTMTYPYGATPSRRWQSIRENAEDKLTGPDVAAIERAVEQAIKDAVPSVKLVMTWLQDIAKTAAAKNRPLWWWSPAGLPVVLEKHRTKQVRMYERIGQRIAKPPMQLPVVPIRMDSMKMRYAVSAYFVHSYDATHLMLVADTARRSGIASLSVEHDSYGTVAADMPLLGQIIRQRFVDLYTEHDPLTAMQAMAAKMNLRPKAPPTRGTLDVGLVRQSEYFFS